VALPFQIIINGIAKELNSFRKEALRRGKVVGGNITTFA
jgi:hypothetical protein